LLVLSGDDDGRIGVAISKGCSLIKLGEKVALVRGLPISVHGVGRKIGIPSDV
jgi:hypothetical protein